MREIIKAEPAVHAVGDVDGRREGALRRPDVQGRDHREGRVGRRWRRRRGLRRGVGRRRDQRVPQHRRFRRHVRRSARAVDGPARPFQAAEGGRRVLARQREGADAAAHLRHGLGVEAGPRRPPPPAGGGGQTRPSQAGDRARPAELPVDARRRSRGVAPEGRHHPQADRGLQPAPAREGRLLVRVHAPSVQRASCSRRPATSGSTPTACIRRWRWTTARTTRSR